MITLDTKVALVEKFYSIQGEGYNAGRASLFIRYAGCNLDCVFADGSVCDTPWRQANEKITVRELLKWVEDHDQGHTDERDKPLIILTGGEPTMAPTFDYLVRHLRRRHWDVAVETNGTIWRDSMNILSWIVVSPKTDVDHDSPLSSPEPDEKVLKFADEFRYVISGPDTPVPPMYNWRQQDHYLSPAIISDGTGTMHMNGFPGFADGAVERCMEIIKGDPRWKLSMQMHKFIGAR